MQEDAAKTARSVPKWQTRGKERRQSADRGRKKGKKFEKKVLTNRMAYDIIDERWSFGGIAQLARATGSYPVGHGFKSNSRYHRLSAINCYGG